MILSLSFSLYLTYLNDVYFASYANSLSPILVPALSVAFGISSASIAAYLYIGIKRIQMERDTEVLAKKRTAHLTKESSEPHKETASAPKINSQPQPAKGRLRPITPSTSHVRSRPHQKEPESQTPLSETKKQP